MTTIPFVDLQAQQRALKEDILQAVEKVITECNFILGQPVTAFEEAFARFIEVKHAIGVSDGLSALKLALTALGVGQGDEVILPANTFIATALAVVQAGATPVLVDCDAQTYNIDTRLIERAISAKTKAIIPVHLTGQAADLDPILQLANERGLVVIEDAAQAHGTLYKEKPCGSIGTAGCFSFYPAKNLGCCGDGGMVTTNDTALAERLRRLRNYGQRVKYEHQEKGENSRLDTLQAAILQIKLPHLKSWNEARAKCADEYRQRLGNTGDLQFQKVSPFSTHIYHLFIIETEHRDALQQHLESNGVQTVIHYPKPIHLQEAFEDLGHQPGDFPVAERLATRMLSLPMYPELSASQIERVVEGTKQYFEQHTHQAKGASE
jgi:dTDP-4-amino-4,6-dideoxygalactose transaminase